jgi:hypothetical protein
MIAGERQVKKQSLERLVGDLISWFDQRITMDNPA